MNEIREVFLKLMTFALYAAVFPVAALFIGALFIERARRILLFFMIVVFLVTMFLAYAVLTHPGLVYAGFEDLWPVLLDSLVRLAPLLVVLAVATLAAVLAGPSLVTSLDRLARQQYLAQVLDHCTAESASFVQQEFHTPIFQPVKGHVLIIGESGSGKSMLMHKLAAAAAKQAQIGSDSPLPVWIEIDRLLAQKNYLETPPSQLAKLQPFSSLFAERLVRRAADQEQVCYFVDCSSSTFTLAPPFEVRRVLFRLIQFLSPGAFVISLPEGYQDPDIQHQFTRVITLEPLDDSGVSKMVRARKLKSGTTGELHSATGSWHALARRPWLLDKILLCAARNGKLPVDLRELFRSVVYPPKMAVEPLEAFLIRMSTELAISGRYWLPVHRVHELAGESEREVHAMILACRRCGLLSDLPGEKGEVLTGFAHPLQLAFFTALAWYQTGKLGVSVEALETNPLLADALVFFNNLDSDSQRFSSQLLAIANEGDMPAQQLVVRCLMAMPQDHWPQEVVEQVCRRVLCAEDFASGGEIAQTAWTLLQILPAGDRTRLFEKALSDLPDAAQHAAVNQLAVLTRSANRPAGDLPDILAAVSPAFCKIATLAWAESFPDETLEEVCRLYEEGPQERRPIALDLLGNLPHEGAEPYLRQSLEREQNPDLRIEILRALVNHPHPGLFSLLLSLVASTREAESVRVAAAQLLPFSDLPEPPAGMSALRNLVRTSRMPMPGAARAYLADLIENLRRQYADQVSAFESLANPYFVNRPVNEPQMFFGQAELIHALVACIENGSDAVVYGERRIGKSSVLRQLQAGIIDSGRTGLPWRVVVVHAEALDAQEFFYMLVAGLLSGLDDPQLPVQPSYALPYQESTFKQDLVGVVNQLKSRYGASARLAILIDGADRVLGYPAQLLNSFRRVIGSDELATSLVVILAAAQPPAPDHPLFGVLAAYPVRRLSDAEALELITRPVEGMLTYEAGAPELLQQYAQGHPHTLQWICQKLVNSTQARGSGQITCQDVREAIQATSEVFSPRATLIEQTSKLMSDLMDWLEAHPNAPRAILEEKLKQSFEGVRTAVIQQVIRQRKAES